MTNFAFAARAYTRNALLCGLLTGLAACGSGGSSSGPGTAAAVTPNVGVIHRTATPSSQSSTPATATLVSSGQGSTVSNPTPSNPTPSNPTPSAGTATVDWTPPTQNNDGSTLTDLGGYYVYYGTSPDKLTETVKVTNPGLSAYTLSNLPAGTWYFAVSSYSVSGVESARTGVVSSKI